MFSERRMRSALPSGCSLTVFVRVEPYNRSRVGTLTAQAPNHHPDRVGATWRFREHGAPPAPAVASVADPDGSAPGLRDGPSVAASASGRWATSPAQGAEVSRGLHA